MAADSIDSRTSTTLSANSPPAFNSFALLRTLANSPDAFLCPSSFAALRTSSLAAAKTFLDPVARQLAAGRKRKGSEVVLNQVYTEGFGVEEIWHQVAGIVGEIEGTVEKRRKVSTPTSPARTARQTLSDLSRESSSSSDEGYQFGPYGGAYDQEDVADSDVSFDEEDSGEDTARARDDADIGEDLEDSDDGASGQASEDGSYDEDEDQTEVFEDPHGLNDGFFSIDDFNKQTERYEMMDQGLVDSDDHESDIDFTQSYGPDPSREAHTQASNANDSEEDFEDEEPNDDDYGNLMYDDFFLPPPKLRKARRENGRNPFSDFKTNFTDNDIEQEMSRVQRDLFEESDEEDVDDPEEQKSLHAKQNAMLAAEIRRLEAENVEKKAWTLIGEVKSKDRPLNALLQEDLDFERVSQPVPVITSEVTDTLENMIKRRIIEGRFDDLERRQPLLESSRSKGILEIDDKKSQIGLADVYANEVTGQNEADIAEKVKAEHREVAVLFKDVMHKLDALSSWHFTPKPPSSEIQVVGDIPAVMMEDVRPTVAGEINKGSMLAPTEVYNPREERRTGEIVTKGGVVFRKEELSTEDKRRSRRHDKKKKKKVNTDTSHGVMSQKEERSKKGIVETLKKGDVKVIGKGGETRTIEGKVVEKDSGKTKASTFKL